MEVKEIKNHLEDKGVLPSAHIYLCEIDLPNSIERFTDDGELEIGQISALITEIKPVKDIIKEIITEFEIAKQELQKLNF